MNGLKILAMGKAVPAQCVTNDRLAERVDTSDEWIASRTGVRQRYFADGETNTALATRAAAAALAHAGVSPEEIAVCVVSTFTADDFTPGTATAVVGNLGLPTTTLSFDLNAACAGFLYGLQVVRGLLAPGQKALLIGSEVISRVLDFNDRNTCVLFGDGAAAAVVERAENTFYFTAGTKSNTAVLRCAAHPVPGRVFPSIEMNGAEVFRFACETVPACIETLLTASNLTLDDIDYVVCHQANERIIQSVVRRMQAPNEKFFRNLQRYGNTSAASIPLALAEMQEEGLLSSGTRTLCVGFGAGLTWGGVILEW